MMSIRFRLAHIRRPRLRIAVPTADVFHQSIAGAHPRLITIDWTFANGTGVRVALVAFFIVVGFTNFAHSKLQSSPPLLASRRSPLELTPPVAGDAPCQHVC